MARGKSTRAKLSSPDKNDGKTLNLMDPHSRGVGHADQLTSNPSGNIDIFSAETTIRAALRSMDGTHAMPDFLAKFQTVDTKHTGYVKRKQFAFVLSQIDSIKLDPLELAACMDYFDITRGSGGGGGGAESQIDYKAFARFCKYREPDMLPAIAKLRKMMLGPQAIAVMRSQYDPSGTGYIRRSDMLRALADLGYAQVPQPQLMAILSLFETRTEGQVNYANFVEYVRENDVSSGLTSLTRRLHAMMTKHDASLEQKTKKWFNDIDQEQTGSFNAHQLADFLDRHDITHVPSEVVLALFAAMEKKTGGNGKVQISDFGMWLRGVPDAISAEASMYGSLTLAELQCKTHAYMLAVANAPTSAGISLEAIHQSYLVYDWPKPATGLVSKTGFERATTRAGFAFTASELRVLSNQFAASNREGYSGTAMVAYKRFLEWATPSPTDHIAQSNNPATAAAVGGNLGTKRTAAAMVKVSKWSHILVWYWFVYPLMISCVYTSSILFDWLIMHPYLRIPIFTHPLTTQNIQTPLTLLLLSLSPTHPIDTSLFYSFSKRPYVVASIFSQSSVGTMLPGSATSLLMISALRWRT